MVKQYSNISTKQLLETFFFYENKTKQNKKQKANGPQLVHLSEIATTDMLMLCNIFPVPSLQLMKGSSIEQFLVLKKNVYFIIFFTIYGHDSQLSMTIWTNSESHFKIWVNIKSGENCPSGFRREVV